MKIVPSFLRGGFRVALRIAFDEGCDATREGLEVLLLLATNASIPSLLWREDSRKKFEDRFLSVLRWPVGVVHRRFPLRAKHTRDGTHPCKKTAHC